MRDTFLIQNGQVFVFIGDSITADTQGYTMLVPEMVRLRYPDRKIEFINAGIGGNRSVDMLERFENDVLRHKPHWVSITSGANDIARFITNPSEAIGLEEYSKAIEKMVNMTIDASAFPILISPPPFEPQWVGGSVDIVNKKMEDYTEWIKKFARGNHIVYVPMFETFREVSKILYRRSPEFKFTEDGVHMNLQGRLLMTITFLRYIGFDWRV